MGQFYRILIVLTAISARVNANIELPAIISDNMVLQTGINGNKAVLWGWENPGVRVNIEGSWGGKVTVRADEKGRWSVLMPVPRASEKTYTITFSGKNKVVVKNVLIGEVWLGSGQSNMAFPVRSSANAKAEMAAADYPMIRMFIVPCKIKAPKPQERCRGEWKVCTPKNVYRFSAALYYFGRDLYKKLKIPVGLINSSKGATRIEAWLDQNTVKKFKHIMTAKALADKEDAGFDRKAAADKIKAIKKKYEEDKKVWLAGGRKGKAPGPIWVKLRRLTPPELRENYPANLYNNMINPFKGYTLRGVIWYQGESNSKDWPKYDKMLVALIENWRVEWKQGDIPFICVQLPDYRKEWNKKLPYEDGDWAEIRQAFVKAAKIVPKTYYTINIDIGDAKNIHPENKQDVGKRLMLMALKQVYNQSGFAWSGPEFVSARAEGGKVIVTWKTNGAPLDVRGNGKIFGLVLSDASGKIKKADAKIIDDNHLEVSAPGITKPVMVAYAWADNPEGSNLINRAGLPAEPFRCKIE